VRVIKVKSRG